MKLPSHNNTCVVHKIIIHLQVSAVLYLALKLGQTVGNFFNKQVVGNSNNQHVASIPNIFFNDGNDGEIVCNIK